MSSLANTTGRCTIEEHSPYNPEVWIGQRRYVVLNPEGIDITGEHHTFREARSIAAFENKCLANALVMYYRETEFDTVEAARVALIIMGSKLSALRFFLEFINTQYTGKPDIITDEAIKTLSISNAKMYCFWAFTQSFITQGVI